VANGAQGRGRLTRSAEFDAVYRRGTSAASRHLVVYSFPSERDDARVGIAVSRKVGNAVVRNRLKRQLREAFDALAPAPLGCDVVLVARPGLDEAVEGQGFAWLAAEVADLIGRSRAA
jgi:ribonuclease P protein component